MKNLKNELKNHLSLNHPNEEMINTIDTKLKEKDIKRIISFIEQLNNTGHSHEITKISVNVDSFHVTTKCGQNFNK